VLFRPILTRILYLAKMFFNHFQWLWGHGCSSEFSQFYPILDAIALTSQTCETCETYRLRYNPAKPIIKEVREIIFFRESQRMDGKVEYVEKV
jgi:hypothetical protein